MLLHGRGGRGRNDRKGRDLAESGQAALSRSGPSHERASWNAKRQAPLPGTFHANVREHPPTGSDRNGIISQHALAERIFKRDSGLDNRGSLPEMKVLIRLAFAFAAMLGGAFPAHAQYPASERSFRGEEPALLPPPPDGQIITRNGSVSSQPHIRCSLGSANPRNSTQSIRDLNVLRAIAAFQARHRAEAIRQLTALLPRPSANFALGCLMDALAEAWLVPPEGPGATTSPDYDDLTEAIRLSRISEDGIVITALARLVRAANADFEPAQFELASRARDGMSRYHPDQAISWYVRLSGRGRLAASAELGALYEDGFHLPTDPAEASRLYALAAAGGDPRGVFLLARASWRGVTGRGRHRIGTAYWLRRLAASGDARAQLIYGLLLRERSGARLSEAQRNLRQAADQGLAGAQYALAHLLMRGGARTPASDNLIEAAAAERDGETGHCMALVELLEHRLVDGQTAVFEGPEGVEQRRRLSRCWYLHQTVWTGSFDLMDADSPGYGIDWDEFAARARLLSRHFSGDLYREDFQAHPAGEAPQFPDVGRLNALLRSRDVGDRAEAAVRLNELGLGRAAIDQALEVIDNPNPARQSNTQFPATRMLYVCDWGPFFAEWVARDWRNAAGRSCAGPGTLAQASIPQLRRLVADRFEDARLFLGLRLLLEDDASANAEGLGLLREASDEGPIGASSPAVVRRALYAAWLDDGRGIDPDPSEAAAALRQAFDAVESSQTGIDFFPRAPIYWRLGRLILDRQTPETYSGEGLQLLQSAAHSGLAPAQTSLGDALLSQHDMREALRWYRVAANAGEPASFVRFAYLADIGLWNEQDLGAERWYQLASSFADPTTDLDLARAVAFAPERGNSLTRLRDHLARAARHGNRWASRWLEACRSATHTACYREQAGFTRTMFANIHAGPSGARSLGMDSRAAAAALATGARALRGRLAIAGEAHDRPAAERALSELETLHANHGSLDQALRFRVERVLLLDPATGRRDTPNYFSLLNSSCLWGQASRFAYRLGRTDAAIWLAKISVNRLQEARALIRELNGDVRECFLEVHQDRYRWLADLFIEAGRFSEANDVLAMLKDFEHQTYLQGASARGTSGARLSLSPLEESANAALARAQAAGGDSSGFRASLDELAIRMRALGRGEADIRAVGSRQLLADLADRRAGTAILQAVVLPDQVRWIISTRQGQEGVAIPIERQRLAELIRQFVEAINSQSRGATEASAELYRAVFAQVDGRLRQLGITEIMLQADGQLRYVPFAALWDGRAWLVERYAFSMFRRREDYLRDADPALGTIAAFGATRGSNQLPPLPEVAGELEGIVRTAETPSRGVIPGTIYLDRRFDRQALETALASDFAVIHVASHFVLDPSSADGSYLLLGDGSALTARDFDRSDRLAFRHARLVTFSACKTALGNGVEIESLASIALDAGARSVLASLWSVSDPSTAQLMRNFYRLRSAPGATTAAALQSAQLEMIQAGGVQSHPYHWAPFILMGRRE